MSAFIPLWLYIVGIIIAFVGGVFVTLRWVGASSATLVPFGSAEDYPDDNAAYEDTDRADSLDDVDRHLLHEAWLILSQRGAESRDFDEFTAAVTGPLVAGQCWSCRRIPVETMPGFVPPVGSPVEARMVAAGLVEDSGEVVTVEPEPVGSRARFNRLPTAVIEATQIDADEWVGHHDPAPYGGIPALGGEYVPGFDPAPDFAAVVAERGGPPEMTATEAQALAHARAALAQESGLWRQVWREIDVDTPRALPAGNPSRRKSSGGRAA